MQLGCNNKHYAHDAASLCKFLQYLYFILFHGLFYSADGSVQSEAVD